MTAQTSDLEFLGKLFLADNESWERARRSLNGILALADTGKSEAAGFISTLSDLVLYYLGRRSPIEIELWFDAGRSICLIQLVVWHAGIPDEALRAMDRFEMTGSRQYLSFVYRLTSDSEAIIDELRLLALEVPQEKTEDEVRQLILDVEAAEAARAAQLYFMRKVSHELRTPLNVILGYSEMLAEDMEDTQSRQDIDSIYQAGKQLLGIIDNVLNFSRMEMGQIELHTSSVSCRDAVKEVVQEMQDALEHADNRFVLHCSDTILEIYTDRGKLVHILKHLLANATKFTEHGDITLTVEARDSDRTPGVSFEVRDSGVGISKPQLEDLFKPFTQLDHGHGPGPGGLGMGLALCRRYAELIGGFLEVDSTPNEGSVFRLWVPQQTTI